MKTLLFIPFLFCLLSLNSCCKDQLESEPRIWIKYVGNEPIPYMYQIRTEKHDLSQIVDTLILENTWVDRPLIDRITVAPLISGDYNHILMSYDSTKFDTIIYISHARDACNRMKEIVYFWNGIYSTDSVRDEKL